MRFVCVFPCHSDSSCLMFTFFKFQFKCIWHRSLRAKPHVLDLSPPLPFVDWNMEGEKVSMRALHHEHLQR